MAAAKILVVDDERDIRTLLEVLLESAGYQVALAKGGAEALVRAADDVPDLAIVDLKMEGMDGIALLEQLLRLHPGLPVLMLSAHGTIANAVDATKKGACGFLTKPFDTDDLLCRLKEALEVGRLRGEVERLRTLVQEHYHFDHIITASEKMHQVLRQVEQIAATDSTVCLYGESGTGKELLAKALHVASRRAAGPFVAINCGAIPEGLLENELFGHVRGAYTGADRVKRGLVQQAEGGTLLLDEVGDLPATLQVKLLRVLQEREFYAVGAEHPTPVDIRLVAATNRDLGQAVAAGKFREDLYYRLHVIPLFLPPLRERSEDIPLLARHFLQHWSRAMDKEVREITPEALDRLLQYEWPGNVRELANVIERAVVLTTTGVITPDLLLLGGRQESPAPRPALEPVVEAQAGQEGERPHPVLEPLVAAREAFEQAYLVRALTATKGNVSQAAKLAHMHRGHFYSLLQKYALDPGAFKGEKATP